MATSAGEVEVKLTLNADDFNRLMNKAQQNTQDFGKAIEDFAAKLAAAFTFEKIAEFFKSTLDAYAENELAVTRLIAALNNQGTASEAVVDHIKALAEALQNQTGISKNAIINAQTFLTTFGLQGEMLDKVTQSVLDLSAATGIDLQRAALLLGKAYEGQTSSLSRYGIIVNQHLDLNKRFAAVMDQVNQRFGGAAQAQAATYTGQLNVMKESFHDLQETIGSMFAGAAGAAVQKMTDLIKTFDDALQKIIQVRSQFGSFSDFLRTFAVTILGSLILSMYTLLGFIADLLAKLPIVGIQYAALAVALSTVKDKISNQIAAWQATMTANAQANGVMLKGEEDKQTKVLQTKQVITQAADAASQFVKDKMAEEQKAREKYAAEAKAAYIDFGKSFVTTTADMWNFATSLTDTFFKGFGDGFAKMLVEGKNFTTSLKALFQSMAEQIISYIVQIIMKLTVMFLLEQALGFPVGGELAGLGMMATGGVITEPSIMVGLRTGSRTMVGEAGPETVSPMSGGNQGGGSADGGGGSGGGDITINISGQFLDGSSSSWQKLMREQIIPQIRRYSMSNPSGPFNRTRGVV